MRIMLLNRGVILLHGRAASLVLLPNRSIMLVYLAVHLANELRFRSLILPFGTLKSLLEFPHGLFLPVLLLLNHASELRWSDSSDHGNLQHMPIVAIFIVFLP